MKFDFKKIQKICINLKRNPQRRQNAEAQFKKFNLDVEFFDAIDKFGLSVPEISPKRHESNCNAILACAMSHIALIKLAKERKLPAVCIFEDDVIFCDDFKERIKYIESINNFDYDIFCLGGHYPSRNDWHTHHAPKTEIPFIHKVLQMGGTYAYVLTEKTYDFILNNWYYGYGIDEFHSNFTYKHFKTYAMTPFVCGHATGKSDLVGIDNWNYENVSWFYQQNELINLVPKIDFRDVTFITAVRIESEDRAFNFLKVIQYLCDNLNTTILIKEVDDVSKVEALLKKINHRNCSIKHFFFSDRGTFHRTKYLNQMLSESHTPIVVNYDIDCLLMPLTYVVARDKIRSGCDLVYPYRNDNSDAQCRIDIPDKNNFDGDLFDPKYHSPHGSKCGHVQFFKTESYRSGFMENESFLSYGPEDVERMERFIKLGYRVEWLPDHRVFHIEHSRGVDSGTLNPNFSFNQALYNQLHNMSKEQLIEYYKSHEYIKKYA